MIDESTVSNRERGTGLPVGISSNSILISLINLYVFFANSNIHVNSSEAKKNPLKLLIDESTVSNREHGIFINPNLILMLITMSFLMITIFILILLNRKKKSCHNFWLTNLQRRTESGERACRREMLSKQNSLHRPGT